MKRRNIEQRWPEKVKHWPQPPYAHEESPNNRVSASMGSQRLYTVKEAAEQLRLGQTKLYELIARRELAAVHIGRATRIPSAALDEFVQMLRSYESL